MLRALHETRDAGEFGHALKGTVAPVSVLAPAGFRAVLRETDCGGHAVCRLAASAHRSHRRARTGGPGLLVCNQLVAGRAVIEQEGRTVVARAGDFWWFRTDRDYALTFDGGLEMVGIAAPPSRLPGVAAAGSAGVLPALDPVGAALGPVLDRFEHDLDGLPPAYQLRVVDLMLDAAETLGRRAAERDRGAAAHGASAVVGLALDHIAASLASPDLTPRSIAAAVHVSPRALHSAFEAAGLSVSSTVRALRLERCRRDLADPAMAHWPVSAIGARWAFASPSHFTALFREAYQATPTAYRRTALPSPLDDGAPPVAA